MNALARALCWVLKHSILVLPASVMMSDFSYMLERLLKVRPDFTRYVRTLSPGGVSIMFFLARYMSMAGWRILLWRMIALSSDLLRPFAWLMYMMASMAVRPTMNAKLLSARLIRWVDPSPQVS